MQPGTPFSLQVNPKIPPRLARLEELAHNLWYSWDRATRELYSRLDPQLWASVGHSPKAFLKRVDEQRLVDAAEDPVYRKGRSRRSLPTESRCLAPCRSVRLTRHKTRPPSRRRFRSSSIATVATLRR
jgi:hypothetical protein